MGTKWDKIEGLLEEAVANGTWANLAMAVEKIMLILRKLDDRHDDWCDQKAEWALFTDQPDLVTYSCIAHLSLMANLETRVIHASTRGHNCCYAE